MDESKLTMYAGDILLCKPINHPRNYTSLQAYIDAIQDCQILNIESKYKYFICPSRYLHQDSYWLE